jgi:hypothetical protein
MEKKNNRENMKQKTDFNNWSISYLKEIYQCGKCKKRNTIVLSSSNTNNTNNTNLQGNEIRQQGQKQFQNCLYCGNPNYV